MPGNLKLLLIEDSVNDTELLLQHLKKEEITPQFERVETIEDIKKALNEKEWDAIICDYNLPQFNAIDALSIVRGLKPEVPCIVVSGLVGEENAVETMKAGASDYIIKGNLTRLVPVLQRELKEVERRKEIKVIEETLKKSEENLRQAQKLESIGQLAGGIAHDFNNLLATILIQTEVLKEGLDPTHSVTKIIEHIDKGVEQIKKSAERATNLTRQLLAFSRKQVLQTKVLNLNTLIMDMEKMLGRVIEEHIELKTNLSPDLKNIKIDPGHLEQILMNLVVNSRDAMPQGGKLTIETKNSYIDEMTAKSCGVDAGPNVLLTITDTGMGMSPEIKKHLFEPFFTTKPVGKGTGLGLCTVYGIVKQNKGLIFIESELGQGATFKLFFPITGEEPLTQKVAAKEIEGIKGTETVLVVEDEEDLRELVCETLRTQGYKVLTAANGVEAIVQLKSSKDKIHLIITDVVMPQMGGLELAKQANLIDKTVKFLFQSGYTQDTLLQAGLDDDQIHFLAKPYPLKVLLNKIRGILG